MEHGSRIGMLHCPGDKLRLVLLVEATLTWAQDIQKHFPDWGTAAALQRWQSNLPKLERGQRVGGTVIARAPFGVWLDISVGHPALLLVPEMAGAIQKRITFEEFPQIGSFLEASVVGMSEKAEICLTQNPSNTGIQSTNDTAC